MNGIKSSYWTSIYTPLVNNWVTVFNFNVMNDPACYLIYVRLISIPLIGETVCKTVSVWITFKTETPALQRYSWEQEGQKEYFYLVPKWSKWYFISKHYSQVMHSINV